MPRWAKALIIAGVLIVLLVIGVIGAGVYWWSNNKDALMAKAKALVEEGQDAGRQTDNQGCVDQAVARYKRDPASPTELAAASSWRVAFGSVVRRQVFAMKYHAKLSSLRALTGNRRSVSASAFRRTNTAVSSSRELSASVTSRGRDPCPVLAPE